jgi:nucleotide-binding universal stress UspA family protein
MKKILCPTDFSESAHDAIAYAAKLAKATGCSLTLLHVKSVFDLSLAETTGSKHISAPAIANRLEEQCREITQTFKISCDAEVVSKLSKLSSIISDVAKDYDLIVMGSNGAEDLYQFFGGSNTYNAIVKTNTPVLIIPEGYTYTEIKSIVYAYDYLRERSLPLTKLVPFLKAVNGKLTVLQIMQEAYSKAAEDDLKELQFIIRNFYGDDLSYEYDTIRSDEVSQSINSYIQRNQPDALALCSVHRNLIERIFHKSIIKNISAISNYPVYVFHQ